MLLHSLTKKRQLIMCLHPLTNKRQLFSFLNLKNYHVLAFWPFLTQCQSWLPVCLSPPTHTWPIESGVFPCQCHLVMIERVEERRPLFLPFLRPSLADGRRAAPPSPITRRMYEGVIFPRRFILKTYHLYIFLLNDNTVIWFQVFLSNTNNFQTDFLTHKWDSNRLHFYFRWEFSQSAGTVENTNCTSVEG